MNETKRLSPTEASHPLETLPAGTLMGKYAIPCILSLVVAALYNIVDQIFIANATYLGSYGNAANTVVFPLTVIALAVAVMIGDGCCTFVSLSLGKGRPADASRAVGNAVVLSLVSGVFIAGMYLLFCDPLITLFGGTVNAETYRLAEEYGFWIFLGIPFFGLDGVLYSMPVADVLTAVLSAVLLLQTYRMLSR